MTEATKVLRDAADLLERVGWCQGYLEDNGKVCMVGALRAAGMLRLGRGPYRELVARVSQQIGHCSWLQWNDRPGRTKEEVIAKLRSA